MKRWIGRIVDAGADACFMEFCHHFRPSGAAACFRQHDLEHVPVGLLEIRDRQAESERADRGCVEMFEIRAGEFAAEFGELLQTGELSDSDAGRDVR